MPESMFSRYLFIFLALTLPALPMAALDYPASVPGELYQQFIDSDLEHAGFAELLIWARSLGLSDKGDKTTLKTIIKEYYQKKLDFLKSLGIPAPASAKPTLAPATTVSPLQSPAPGPSGPPTVPVQVSPGPDMPKGSPPPVLPGAGTSSVSPPLPPSGDPGQDPGVSPEPSVSAIPDPAGLGRPGPSASPANSSANDYEISIVSAAGGRYFTIEAADEKLFRLLGGVQLLVTEKKNGNKHSIKAGEIIFDQDSNQMVARVDVEYSLTQGSETQTFTGQEMLFTPSSGDAVFIKGKGNKSQTMSGSGVQVFHIDADLIIRTLRDILVFYHASLSSSVWTPDAYKIGASRIWVLSPGEWAINDLVLYMGAVPVFYLPFFYIPPDELVFHPAVGTRTVEGSYFQTTWYLIGKKKQSDQGLSFLQLDSGIGNDYLLEPHGLFLKKVPRRTNAQSSGQAAAGSGQGSGGAQASDSIKASLSTLTLDYYSRLGFLSGFNLDFAGAAIIKAGLKLKLAATKWIFAVGSNNFTDLYLDTSNQTTQQVWDVSHLFGTDIPFRYALDFSTTLKIGDLNSTIILSLPSDPYILSLYSNRAEDIDWSGLLGMGKDSSTSTSGLGKAEPVTPISINNNFSSSLGGVLDPLVKNFTLKELSLRWQWQLGTWSSVPDQTDPNDVPASVMLGAASVSSEKQFYYPSNLTLPSASFTVSGTILEYPPSTKTRVQPSPTPPASPGAKAAAAKPVLLFPGDTTETGKEGSPEASPKASPGPDQADSTVSSRATPGPGQSDAGTVETERASPDQAGVGGPSPDPENPPSPSPADEEITGDGFIFDLQPVALDAGPITGLPLRFNLGYSVNPSGNLQAKFVDTKITDPYDINPLAQYWMGTWGLNSGLTYTVGALYDMFTASGGITLSWADKEIFGQAKTTTTAVLDAARLAAAMADTVNVTQNNTVNFYPFKFIPFLASTNIQYTLAELLYQKKYQGLGAGNTYLYSETPFAWNSDMVTAHGLSGTLSMAEDWFGLSANLTWTMPPKTELISYNSTLTLDFFGLTYNGTASKVQDVWTLDTMNFVANARIMQDLRLDSTLTYSPREEKITGLKNTFTWGIFTASANWTKDQREKYQPGTGWSVLDEAEIFQLSDIGSTLRLKWAPPDLWEGRIRQDLALNVSFTQSLIRATQSLLSYDLSYGFKLNEFLDLTFSIRGENTKVYRYFDALCQTVGVSTVNIFEDLGRSLNIFDESALKSGFFKLKTLSLMASHDMGDWTLSLNLAAAPKLTTTGGTTSSTWDSTLTLLLQWKPIKELKQKMIYKSLTGEWSQVKE